MSNLGWRHFDHAADMGVRAVAGTLGELFEQMALGVVAIVTTAKIRNVETVALRCSAPDLELLLVDWLNALIFEMSTRRMLFGRFVVIVEPHPDECLLKATAWGEPVDVHRHQPAVELKGATYTALRVHQDETGCWQAQCVVDV